MKKNILKKAGIKQVYSRGFTLIELLISVAIIGILATIVVAALFIAKNKGTDAAIQEVMTGMRSQAGLYHAGNGNYGTAAAATSVGQCTAANSLFVSGIVSNLSTLLIDVAKKNGGTVGTSKIVCSTIGNPATAWAVLASTSDAAIDWCVDSAGQSKAVTGANEIDAVTGACK